MSFVPADREAAGELLAALAAYERVCRSEGRTMHAELRAIVEGVKRLHGRRSDTERRTTTPGDTFAALSAASDTVTEEREFLTLAEVAEMFDRSSRTVQRWVATGRLPASRMGRASYVHRSALRELGER